MNSHCCTAVTTVTGPTLFPDDAYLFYCANVLGMVWETLRGFFVLLAISIIIQGYFYAVHNYVEKADLSKGYCYPKRKLGATMHFSEIIEVQFAKKCHTLLWILQLFRILIIAASLFLKNVLLPSIFLLEIYFSGIVINNEILHLYT